MWGGDYHVVSCVYCKKVIDGCCYPAYEGTIKIGYRHVNCYETKAEQPSDYAKPFGEVTDEDIWKGG